MKQSKLDYVSSAEFSECGKYRFELRRVWANHDKPRLLHFLLLNPSTADEKIADATVERCERRALMLGYDGFIVTNIFAWRSTDPWVLYDLPDPVGQLNDAWILGAAEASVTTICGWGGHGRLHGRGDAVKKLLDLHNIPLHYLKMSQITGDPWHPLYIGYSVQPVEWK